MVKKSSGFIALAKKSFTILTASIAALVGNDSKANSPMLNDNSSDADKNNIESIIKRKLRPKLVLKLNMTDPLNSMVSMHTSHSSHRSHSSHSSHSSHYSSSGGSGHSSHYSSSPSYTPPITPSYTPPTPRYDPYMPPAPIYKPVTKQPIITTPYYKSKLPSSSQGTIKSANSEELTFYILGSRILQLGCEGTDVQELQKMLLNLGYDLPTSGYFGEKTERAVRIFQGANDIKVDGRVGNITLKLIKIAQ